VTGLTDSANQRPLSSPPPRAWAADSSESGRRSCQDSGYPASETASSLCLCLGSHGTAWRYQPVSAGRVQRSAPPTVRPSRSQRRWMSPPVARASSRMRSSQTAWRRCRGLCRCRAEHPGRHGESHPRSQHRPPRGRPAASIHCRRHQADLHRSVPRVVLLSHSTATVLVKLCPLPGCYAHFSQGSYVRLSQGSYVRPILSRGRNRGGSA
jgi:hypothetical protein